MPIRDCSEVLKESKMQGTSQLVQICPGVIAVSFSACSCGLTVRGVLLACWLVPWCWTALWIRWLHLEGSRPSGLRRRPSASERFLNWGPLEPAPHRSLEVVADPTGPIGLKLWRVWAA